MKFNFEYLVSFKYVKIPFVINISFFLGVLFVFLIFSSYYSFFVSFLSSVFIYLSLFFHELGHLFAALRKEVKNIRGFYIHFLGSTLFFDEDISDGKKEGYIALSGPLVSIVLSYIFYVVYIITDFAVFNILSLANFLIAIVNLIPVYPLDGGRALRGFLLILNIDIKKVDIFLKIKTLIIGLILIIISLYYSFNKEYLEFFKFYILGVFFLVLVFKDLHSFFKEIFLGGKL